MGKYQLLTPTLRCEIKYNLDQIYTLTVKSSSLFDNILNAIFSTSLKGSIENEEIVYRDFQIKIPEIVLVDRLLIKSNVILIKVFNDTSLGCKVLDLIIDEYKKMRGIQAHENIIKEIEYGTSIKVKANFKLQDTLKPELLDFFKHYGNEITSRQKEQIDLVFHPFVVRGSIITFPKGADILNSDRILDTYLISIHQESYEEYITNIISFFSELPYEKHISLIERFFSTF